MSDRAEARAVLKSKVTDIFMDLGMTYDEAFKEAEMLMMRWFSLNATWKRITEQGLDGFLDRREEYVRDLGQIRLDCLRGRITQEESMALRDQAMIRQNQRTAALKKAQEESSDGTPPPVHGG